MLIPGSSILFFGSVWKYQIILVTDTSAPSPGVPAGAQLSMAQPCLQLRKGSESCWWCDFFLLRNFFRGKKGEKKLKKLNPCVGFLEQKIDILG